MWKEIAWPGRNILIPLSLSLFIINGWSIKDYFQQVSIVLLVFLSLTVSEDLGRLSGRIK